MVHDSIATSHHVSRLRRVPLTFSTERSLKTNRSLVSQSAPRGACAREDAAGARARGAVRGARRVSERSRGGGRVGARALS